MRVPIEILIDEVNNLGGSLTLLIDGKEERFRFELPAYAEWLVGELRRRKPEVIRELKQRYLQRVQ